MNGLFVHDRASRQLLFGLDWLPLITDRADRTAYALARRQRASHYVHAGQMAASAGFCYLRAGQARRGSALHSAAQCLARLHGSGTVAAILPLDESVYWFAAVHEGAVVARTDSLHVSPQAALEIVEDLRRAYPGLTLLGMGDVLPPSLDALEAMCGAETQLLKVRRYARLVLPASSLLAAGLAAWAYVSFWPNPVSPAGSSPPVSAQEAARLWRGAVDDAFRGVALHGVAGTRAALESFYALPASLSGWVLNSAACTPMPGFWKCEARYRRSRIQASNDLFLAAAPAGWDVRFSSIDHAVPSWRVPIPMPPVGVDQLRSTTHNQRHWQSALQAIRPAFTQMSVGQAQAIAVKAPVSEAGLPVARPADLQLPGTRSIQIGGPLRSASLLLAHVRDVQWKNLALLVSDIQTPNLKTSRFTVTFVGELYEMHPSPVGLP